MGKTSLPQRPIPNKEELKTCKICKLEYCRSIDCETYKETCPRCTPKRCKGLAISMGRKCRSPAIFDGYCHNHLDRKKKFLHDRGENVS